MTNLNLTNETTKLVVQSSSTSSGSPKITLTDGMKTTLSVVENKQILNYTNTAMQVLTVGLVGPAGKNASQSTGGGTVLNFTIPPQQSLAVDTFDDADVSGKWGVSLTNDSSQQQTYEVLAGWIPNKGETDWTKFAILGDRIPHITTFDHAGLTTTYRIANPSVTDNLYVTLVVA